MPRYALLDADIVVATSRQARYALPWRLYIAEARDALATHLDSNIMMAR